MKVFTLKNTENRKAKNTAVHIKKVNNFNVRLLHKKRIRYHNYHFNLIIGGGWIHHLFRHWFISA